MAETVQQYMSRILAYVGKQDPLKIQRATPKRLERLVRGVPKKTLRRRLAPGKWSAVEILAHLAETELVGGYRIRTILARNGAPIQAFDQNKWAQSGNYARHDPRKSLEVFRVLRESNLRLLQSVPRRKWNNYGRHEERGKETLARFVRLYAGHDINHLRQIERILQS